MLFSSKYLNNTSIKHDCKDELNASSLRATPARMALMNLLESSDSPLDVAAMIDYLNKKDIKTDPATVFRIMNMFLEKGIVKQISFNEGKLRYELSAKADHHHFICERCNAIEDISDCNIDQLEKNITEKKGLLVKRHSLEFFGVCKQCQY